MHSGANSNHANSNNNSTKLSNVRFTWIMEKAWSFRSIHMFCCRISYAVYTV